MKLVRVDKKMDSAINKGLAAALLAGIPAGVKVMNAAGVPPEIVSRVVLAPQHRRATDWKS